MEVRKFLLSGSLPCLLLVYVMFCTSNNVFPQAKIDSYDADWQKVEVFKTKSLPSSALEVVERIYSRAKKDKNQPEQLKAILFKINLQEEILEESEEMAIKLVNDEVKTADFPASAIYHSVLAEMYWNYYASHRYLWLKRSITQHTESDDIKTWDLQKLMSKVIEHHLAALKNDSGLMNIQRNDFKILLQDEIFNTEEERKDAIKSRPTLYDFLAHRAIDRFMNEETTLSQPAESFQLDDSLYLMPFYSFTPIRIDAKDSLSLKFIALRLIQDLTSFHHFDTDPTALIDVDLKRLDFVHRFSILDNKDELYGLALKNLQYYFKDHPVSADVAYQRALFFQAEANKFKPFESDKHKDEMKTSMTICEEANKKFPASTGARNCRLLMKQLQEVQLSLTLDDVVIPDKPNLALLNYQNVERVYWRLLQIDPAREKEIRQTGDQKKILKAYLSLEIAKSGSLDLPVDKDYRVHHVQIPLPALACGYYIILISASPDFNPETNPISYTSFWSSNISYISRYTNTNDYELYVIDRKSGHALKEVTVEGWISDYDNKSRARKDKLWKSFVTDNEGYVKISNPEDKNPKSFYLNFKTEKDRLASEDYFYISNYQSNTGRDKEVTVLFTDRAIYRPGQTIYYKGIVFEGKGSDLKVRPNFQTLVVLYDMNDRDLGETHVTTNEFGSFSGTFTAPTGGLNGSLRIMNEYGTVSVRVEEYKRPRFETRFLPVEGEYSLNSKIKLTGTATTYSGIPVDAAKVVYRVVRTARFPYWGDYDVDMPSSASQEICHGETYTNNKGEYQLIFTAFPDKLIAKSVLPVFHYEVYADVTDLNGEVRSANTSITAGYASFILNSNLPKEINSDEAGNYTLTAKNLAGKDVTIRGELNVYELKRPDRLARSRKWNRPDKFVMKEDEFHKTYPLDLYDNENDKTKWEKKSSKIRRSFYLPTDSVLDLDDIKKWKSGDYILDVCSVDKDGDTVRLQKYFTLIAEARKEYPANTLNWFNLTDQSVEPGSTVNASFATSLKDVRLIYELTQGKEIISRKILNASDEMISLPISVLEDYRGNIAVQLTFIKDNRYYQMQGILKVPYTNKELDISFETFRDKLSPGQKEEWKMKISGQKKEKVAAELLLGMYDASLDAFVPHNWPVDQYHPFAYFQPWKCQDVFDLKYTTVSYIQPKGIQENYYFRKYDRLINDNVFYMNYRFNDDLSEGFTSKNIRSNTMKAGSGNGAGLAKWEGETEMVVSANAARLFSPNLEDAKADEKLIVSSSPQSPARTNLNETAFFFPDLKTDAEGNIIVHFTLPESLTRWKVMGLAHTKDMKMGLVTKEVLAQKDLMVYPNPPRFFREGDNITFSTKISSLSKTDLTGQVSLQLFDALTQKEIGNEMFTAASHGISLPAGASTSSSWTFSIPSTYQAIGWKITATAGNFSDGEESTLPVLSNRQLVTESMTLPIHGKGKFAFELKKLSNLEKNPSSTLKNHLLSLEFTTNPAWYAIQALPYLMEYPYECAEQTFNRYYANQLATFIASSDPSIHKVFETWSKYAPSALQSKLEKNQDLKSIVLEETPWVMQAKDENERRQRIGLLFDLNRMANELNASLDKLKELQTPNGGWPWFAGMPDDRYITQYILCGYGHLSNLGIINSTEADMNQMMERALQYSDLRNKEDYEELLKYSPKTLGDNHLDQSNIQYLYAKSFYLKPKEPEQLNKMAFEYYKGQARKYWTSQNPYMQGMIALALFRFGDAKTAKDILKSLKERALHNEEMGMYWKDNTSGYYWHQQNIATQALLIEAFDVINKDSSAVEDMKLWLLKQKQCNDWKTTTATADACYALLLRGTDLLKSNGKTEITVGNVVLQPGENSDIKTEAGTGYFRQNWYGDEVHTDMAKVTVDRQDKGVAWGALYWQYFENLDKITAAASPVKIDRQLFLKKNTDKGPVLEKVTIDNPIKIGDKVVVRITLNSDRDMEYVHLKDLRAAGLEPTNVLSGYQYQDGLGFYQSTKDVATHFFFSELPKGRRIFEYTLTASQKGEFSQGICSIECMYAPEFSAHSEGIKIKIE